MVKDNQKEKKAKVTISTGAKRHYAAYAFIGISTIVAGLALIHPFFRHVMTFGTFTMTVLFFLGTMAAKDDYDNGVKRTKPSDWGAYRIPAWAQNSFFLLMMLISSGLKLGFYIVPVAWLVIWMLVRSMVNYIEATFIETPEVHDPCHPDWLPGK